MSDEPLIQSDPDVARLRTLRNRLDAEMFAIECKRRGVPVEYWPDGLAAAEELLNREDTSDE